MAEIVIRGLDELNQILAEAGAFLDSGELGRVFSAGAYGPHGQRYESYVQGEGQQASIHQGRWQTEADAVTKFEPVATDILSDELQRILQGDGPGGVKSAVQALLDRIHEYMAKYPPPPPNSTYVRTDTLHHSWQSELRI